MPTGARGAQGDESTDRGWERSKKTLTADTSTDWPRWVDLQVIQGGKGIAGTGNNSGPDTEKQEDYGTTEA